MASGTTAFNFPDLDDEIKNQYFKVFYSEAAGSQVVKSGRSFVHSIAWEMPDSGLTAGVEIFDAVGASNEVFAAILSGAHSNMSGSAVLDCYMNTGISVVITGAAKITITWTD